MSEDRIRWLGGIDFYAYVVNNPALNRDPRGLDIAVIENGPTQGNPIGHTSIAITGAGLYSSGNDTDPGSSLTNILREAGRGCPARC